MPDPIDLDAIRTRAEAATPGPWHWSGYKNRSSGVGPYIATWIPGHGRCTVMDFSRLGMRGAQPRFRNPDGWRMVEGVELAVREVPYRDDVASVDHPDAEFIVHARQDVPALLELLEKAVGLLQTIVDDADGGDQFCGGIGDDYLDPQRAFLAGIERATVAA